MQVLNGFKQTLVIFIYISTFMFSQAQGDGGKVAVVLIDMQNKFVYRGGVHGALSNYKKYNGIIDRQLQLIRRAKENKLPILVVEYGEAGPTTQRLRQAVGNYPDSVTIVKDSDGLFDSMNSTIESAMAQLSEWGVSGLLLAGANGGACVRDTIEGARIKGFRVLVDARTIADFNDKNFVYPYHYEQSQFNITTMGQFQEITTDEELAVVMAGAAKP